MSRSGVVALVSLLLAALAALAPAAPAVAHTGTPSAPTPDLPAAEIAIAPAPAPGPGSASVSPWVFAGLLLLSVSVARRSPRRVLALALVLLLTIFALENALHSVHHGFDAAQSAECSMAGASAHLSAVSVDGIVETSVILAVAGPTAEPDLSRPSSRPPGPDQGRAPPVPTV